MILAQVAHQSASESELIAKEEVDQFVRLMEESGQRIEEFEAELASATQEVENYRSTLESVQLELDNLRFENSRGQARISEGHDRRATLLRSNGDLTVVGVLQALRGSPKTSSTINPAPQKSYHAELDFLMEQAVEDDEDNVQDRMIKTPLKHTDLVAAGDDDRILGKIVELAFVPISPALTREMPDDSNHHGFLDIGDTLKQGFTSHAAVIRLMTKADPMEMSDDFFELANKGSDCSWSRRLVV